MSGQSLLDPWSDGLDPWAPVAPKKFAERNDGQAGQQRLGASGNAVEPPAPKDKGLEPWDQPQQWGAKGISAEPEPMGGTLEIRLKQVHVVEPWAPLDGALDPWVEGKDPWQSASREGRVGDVRVGSVEEAIARFALDKTVSEQLRALPQRESDNILVSLNASVRNPKAFVSVAVQNAVRRLASGTASGASAFVSAASGGVSIDCVGSVDEAVERFGLDRTVSEQFRSLPQRECDSILSSLKPSVRNPKAFLSVAVQNAVKRVGCGIADSAGSAGGVGRAAASVAGAEANHNFGGLSGAVVWSSQSLGGTTAAPQSSALTFAQALEMEDRGLRDHACDEELRTREGREQSGNAYSLAAMPDARVRNFGPKLERGDRDTLLSLGGLDSSGESCAQSRKPGVRIFSQALEKVERGHEDSLCGRDFSAREKEERSENIISPVGDLQWTTVRHSAGRQQQTFY